MNNSNRKSSLRKSNDCIFRKSPSVSLKSSVRESKIDHLVGVNLEQKLHTFRTRMLGSLSSHESQSSIPTPVVVPLKPMPYVRCFNVTVSLKKSRLLRFFFVFLNFKEFDCFGFSFQSAKFERKTMVNWKETIQRQSERSSFLFSRNLRIWIYRFSRVTDGLSIIIWSKILPNIWPLFYSTKSDWVNALSASFSAKSNRTKCKFKKKYIFIW